MSADTAALDYLLFDPAPFDFPPARLPVMQPLRLGALRWGADKSTVPAWSATPARHYGRARYALRDAFRLSGVGPGGALLAPAYHCRTMIDPAIALDAPVRFYAVDEALRPHMPDLARQLTDGGTPIKAVLVSHFFGMAQDLEELSALCRGHGVPLVEDCAQSLPLSTPFNHMGKTGTWCVASPWKFYPCEDGGALWSGDGKPFSLPPLRSPSLRTELAQVRRMWERSRVRAPREDGTAPAAAGTAPAAPTPRELEAQSVSRRLQGPSREYDRGREATACAKVSRWIVAHSDTAELLARRRANYERLAAAVSELPNARALQPRLGPHDTPYMFPLLIDRPERDFAALKRAGLPIWRWDSLAASDCITASKYRLRLLHLPCHQSLGEAELGWMVRVLGSVLRADLSESRAHRTQA